MDRISRELTALAYVRNAVLFIAAAVLTALFSYFGIDWLFYSSTRSQVFLPLVYAAGLGGFIMPVAVPLSMLLLGVMRRDAELRSRAWALARAILYALAIVALLKAITGRAHPQPGSDLVHDITRDFNFGFLKEGIFWGWPSSHAASATALASSFAGFLRTRTALLVAIAYAAVVCTGAAIGFHWLSDVIAGATIGTVVGITVSKAYLRV